jgi:aspartyl/glutamyl-tRNA(Asn/Gln) amidotransferase C subunit
MPGDERSRTEIVHRTAALARLELGADEARELGGHLERILAAFAVLESAELAGAVDGVQPLSDPAEAADVLREDRPVPGLDRAELLARAPRGDGRGGDGPDGRDGEFFRVPKTVGGGG